MLKNVLISHLRAASVWTEAYPEPQRRDCSKQKKKKKNGIEVSIGNRLKKEKHRKDLDALTQSSLAFNPCVCVCMIVVGAGGDEKKVKVDSVFLL